mgnify:FL=1
MKKRKSYPILYKFAFAIGKENELVPLEEQLKIPKQTKYSWRTMSDDSIEKLENQLQIKKEFHNMLAEGGINMVYYRRLLYVTAKIHYRSIDFIGEKKYHKILERNKEDFVTLIETYSSLIPKETLLKWFKFKPNKYLVWFFQIQYQCDSSVMKLCARKFPAQITLKEFAQIEKAFKNTKYTHWSKSAIHADLVKNNLLTISRSTFYKHAATIRPTISGKSKKRRSYRPLRASRINEYWHFDISYFRTLNGERQYIYAIIDNYSRKILAWRCKDKIRNVIVSEMLAEALGLKKVSRLVLVSDGGTENIGHNIHKILEYYRLFYSSKIDHKIALKGIRQSNSMIERFFKLMKYDYLYLKHAETPKLLVHQLKRMIIEYNYIRPHYALGLLTPDERYRGLPDPDLTSRMKKAYQKRFCMNKKCDCIKCINE